MPAVGDQIGVWRVEAALDGPDRWLCHHTETPFRKAEARLLAADVDLKQLRAEAAELARLRHRGIPAVIGVEPLDDGVVLLVEPSSGEPLTDWIRQPPLPLRAAVEALDQLTRALQAAHDHGVAHRRLQPAYVLLGQDGRVHLVGFTLAASSVETDDAYRAPELAVGLEAGPLQDAYALGRIAAELLEGRLLHDAPGPLEITRDVPPEIRELVRGLTTPSPASRATVDEAAATFSKILRQSLGGTTEEAPRPPADATAGPQRFGRYEVVREIGRGGMGVVYEANDPELRRRVALKVLLSGPFARDKDIERFLREARAVARLKHPGIVPILELGQGPLGAWFAMEYVDGPTLAERTAEARVPWRVAVQITSHIARALQAAHDAGIVHRDVKPSNILLEGDRPRLTDFGLAYDASADVRLTQSGQVVGTPLYMSPEQALGRPDEVGPRTDVYAAGAVLYEMLTGQAPFEGATPLEVLSRLEGGRAPSPQTLNPELPDAVARMCLQAIAFEAEDRYATAAAFAEDLDRCLEGQPVLARTPPRPSRSSTPALPAVLAVGAVGLLVVFAVALFARPTPDAVREQLAAERLDTVQQRLQQLEADGAHDDADALWSAFEAEPAMERTRALVRGWMVRAAHLAGRDDAQGAAKAWSAAYADALDSDDQASALLGLASVLAHAADPDRLPRVMRLLGERAPNRLGTPTSAPLQLLADASLLDLDTAASHADGSARRVLTQIAMGTPTPHRDVGMLETPGGQLLLKDRADPDRLRIVARRPDLAPRGVRRLPAGLRPNDLQVVDDGLFAATHDATAAGVLLAGSTDLVEVHRWPKGRASSAGRADLDGDGTLEHYVGANRRLYRVEHTEADGYTLVDAHPGTSHSNSEFPTIFGADVDGDGSDELVVAASEWGAYDLRILDGAPAKLIGRVKLGTLGSAALIPGEQPAFAVVKQGRYPNRRVFPENAPLGVPAGIYVVEGPPDDLKARRVLDVACNRIQTGDLDGDGQVEIVATCGFDTWLVMGSAYESVARLPRVQPILVSDLDGDGDAELVVRLHDHDDQLWTLGAGTMPLPTRTLELATPVPAPSHTDAATADAWRRADDLAFVGQLDAAADAFERLAVLAPDPRLVEAAQLRAADVHTAAGTHDEAARLLESIAGDDPERLRRAASAWRNDVDPARELALLSRLEASGDATTTETERIAELQQYLDPPRIDLDLTKPLDASWEVLEPLSLRTGPDGLEVDAWRGRILARRPVEWDGGWLRFEIEVTMLHAGWGSGVAVALVPRGEDGPLTGIQMGGGGGGGFIRLRTDCRAEPETVWSWPTLEQPTTVALDIWPHRTGLRCSILEGDTLLFRQSRLRPLMPPDAEEWDLAIVSTGQDSLARALIRRISVTNSAPAEARYGPASEARRAAVNGELTLAGRLSPPGVDPALDAAIALSTGDDAALDAALRNLDAGEGSVQIEQILHTRVERAVPAAQRALGPNWVQRLHGAWWTTMMADEDDPRIQDALVWVADVDPADLPTLADRAALVGLLSKRDDKLEESLAQLLALLEEPDLSPQHRIDLAEQVPRVRTTLAARAVETGDADTAFALLDTLLASAPAPVIAADMLAIDPRFDPIRDDPRWARVESERHPR